MSRIGVEVNDVYEFYLAGLPNLSATWKTTLKRMLEQFVVAAENKVELDLDLLLGEREVRCIRDQSDPLDDEDDSMILPPMDKPNNWFAANRQGILKLPKGPCKSVVKMTLYPYGWFGGAFEIKDDDVSRKLRLSGKTVSVVPGAGQFYIFPLTSHLNYSLNDQTRVPGGIEIIYRAGLSKRQVKNEYPLIKVAVMVQAALMALSAMQIQFPLIQKEQAATDGMVHSIELPSRSTLGALGGEIKNLGLNYQNMISSIQADNTLAWAWL